MTAGGVAIRRLHELGDTDLGRLAGLLVAVVGEGASVGWLAPLEPATAAAYWLGLDLESVHLLVAETDAGIVGTGQLLPAAAENGSHRAEVAKLLVDPAVRRRGVGSAVMAALEAEAAAAGRTMLVLDTRAGDPSNDLYLSLGWTEAGRVPGYARSSTGLLHTTVLYYKSLSPASPA